MISIGAHCGCGCGCDWFTESVSKQCGLCEEEILLWSLNCDGRWTLDTCPPLAMCDYSTGWGDDIDYCCPRAVKGGPGQCIVIFFVFGFAFMLVRSCFLITVIKCLKGHWSLGSLFNVKKQNVSHWVSQWVSQWQGHLLSCQVTAKKGITDACSTADFCPL